MSGYRELIKNYTNLMDIEVINIKHVPFSNTLRITAIVSLKQNVAFYVTNNLSSVTQDVVNNP